MPISFKIPFYAQAALIFIGIFAFVFTLYIGQEIIIPIVYATVLAVLLNPLVNYLVRKKVNKIIAISLAITLTILIGLGILYIISMQISMFSATFPQLKEKFNATSDDMLQWISEKFNIRPSKVNTWVRETKSEALDNFAYGEKLTAAGRVVMTALLVPVYLFMLLFYKTLLLEFIRKLFRTEHHVAVAEVLTNTKKIIQSYLVGLFVEMIMVAALNSAGLLLLGIDYAIILGITGAILNVIPYIGGIVAVALPMVIAFVTKEDSATYAGLVLLVYMFIQFVDNHYIVPSIVASRVQINALISVIVVLIGGALWGISGMFLSIPLTAITKVIFDHVEPLKPWGFLLGNMVPTSSRFFFNRQKIIRKTALHPHK
jgi:predicted PurR-regulated permease PerM